MQVKQIYELVNSAVKSSIGETAVVADDLSNLVDVGTAIFNANAVDNYARKLVDAIGKVIFVNRKYEGFAPKVLMDSWEYGSVVEKIRAISPEATENPTWNLQDGQTYDQDKFTAPQIVVKFFNSKTTLEVPVSITRIQIKESFTSVEKANGLIELIYTTMENGMVEKLDALTQRLIVNMMGETIKADYGTAKLGSKSGIKAVNLLKLYNDATGAGLTTAKALFNKEFLQYASYIIGMYLKRMTKMSKLFNVEGVKKFTPRDLLHVVLLSDFAKASDTFLGSNTFHNELVALPQYEEVPYWQGTGTDYSENATIKVAKLASDAKTSITVTGKVLGCMFDRDALGITNYDKRVPSHPNDHAEFWNLWYKQDASFFNDLAENFVVFFIQDPEAA